MVPGNLLSRFRYQVERHWFRTLSQRSHRRPAWAKLRSDLRPLVAHSYLGSACVSGRSFRRRPSEYSDGGGHVSADLEAIASKRPIEALYKGLPRLFCPHRLGRNRGGEMLPAVLSGAILGGSENQTSRWLFPITSPLEAP